MKFNLPLLLALPLLWQATAWSDEWADIATAVTVTDGYMCAGELYGDGTGTDILCDSINPYVTDNGSVGIGTASPGNSLTVVGDASVTTLNAEQLCDEDGANCTDLSDGVGVSTLVSLTDVSPTAATEGQVLAWDDTNKSWEPSDTSVINSLNDIGDVSGTAADDGQVLTWDNANSEWAPADAVPGAFSCPAGFTLIQNAGQTLGCFQNTANSAASCNAAIDACWTNHGGILPPYSIARMVDSSNLISVSVSSMWTGEASYSSGYQCGRYNASSGRPTSDSYSNNDNYHCFIPATGQIELTTLTALSDVSITTPIDGDTLVWSSSNNSWEAGSSGGGTPSGAVIAFNLASCPTGWSEYTAARGRFVRGIDSTGTNDPDGIRAIGSVQADDWKSFSLQALNYSSYVNELFMGKNSTYTGSRFFGGHWSSPASGIRLKWDSSEIRPKNVALLYCEKN